MTLKPADIPLVVSRGATFMEPFRAVDDDGVALTFADTTAELYAFAADDLDGDTALVTLTTANGGITLGLAGDPDVGFGQYNILLYIGDSATRTMTPFVGWYLLDLIDVGRHQRIMKSSFCVEGGK